MPGDDEDPVEVVRRGYDAMAERYLAAVDGTATSPALTAQIERHLARFTARVPAGAAVLDLGCGAGVPVTRALAARYRVTGVDVSPRQVGLARQHVPSATFVVADMLGLELPAAAFGGVVAFFSLIHVPRERLPGLLARIAGWLSPGGVLLAPLGAKDVAAHRRADWLGAPMFWSHHDADTSRRLVEAAGLEVETAEVERIEDGVEGPEAFLWVLARRPDRGGASPVPGVSP